MKKVYSFRLSEQVIKKLDKVVKHENELLEKRGILALEYSRINILELLIDIAFNMTKKGQSIQDLFKIYKKNNKGDGENVGTSTL